MRQRTLYALSFIIAFPVAFLGNLFLPTIGYDVDLWIEPRFGFLASAVTAPVIAFLLTPLNKRLLAWRKSRGRDVEEEERYETDHGIIRLTPNEGDSTKR